MNAALHRLVGVVLVVAAGALAGCPADPRDTLQSPVVAKIGDVELREAPFLAMLSQRGTARIADDAARRDIARVTLDDHINEELFIQGAQKASVEVRPEEVERELRGRADGYPPGSFARVLAAEQVTLEQFREHVRRRLLADAFLRGRLSEAKPVTDADVAARFEQQKSQMMSPPSVRVRQILVRTTEEAQSIVEQVRSKKLAFDEAARRFSISADAENGGEIGWIVKGEMPAVFDICFILPVNTVSDVTASDYGFHVFQVIDKREEHETTLEEVRERLEEELVRERYSDVERELLAELKKSIKVSIDERAFDRVLKLLPPAPATPNLSPPSEMSSTALDAHGSGQDPIPPVPRPDAPPPEATP